MDINGFKKKKNTDYKIITKAIATQLATEHACHLLHPDQTGFIPT